MVAAVAVESSELLEGHHPQHPHPMGVCSEHRPEALPPEADGFVVDIDAAFTKQILDVPQTQREADVHHHNEPDHLG